jgi:hypothetical protein
MVPARAATRGPDVEKYVAADADAPNAGATKLAIPGLYFRMPNTSSKSN